ncbi:MAG: hypothetical protein AAF688_15245 [Bacteroidota bacterium]
MKFVLILSIILYCQSGFSQINTDTIYGNPKSLREKVDFYDANFQNYKFLELDGDYGHSLIFTPENVKDKFKRMWYRTSTCFYINYEKNYDSGGLPLNETWYYKNGDVHNEYFYKYNKNGKLIESIEQIDDINRRRIRRLSYDRKGNLVATIAFNEQIENGFGKYSTFKYDSLNNLISYSNFNKDGYADTYYNSYNSKGQLIEESLHAPYFEHEIIKSKSTSDIIPHKPNYVKRRLDYNIDGNIIKEVNYRGASRDSSMRVYCYNDTKNLVEERYYYKPVDTNRYRIRRLIYDNNLLMKETYSSNSKHDPLNQSWSYTYNGNGDIKELTLLVNEKLYNIKYQYKFDRFNNWIEIIKIVDERPLYKWTRRIEYY